MDLVKKIWHFIMSVIMYSVFFILVVVGICVGLYFIDQFQSSKSGVQRPPLFGAYVIISPSMIPKINVYDAVVTMRKDVEKIDKEDIITFISKDPSHYGITITHRVVGIFDTEAGGVAYRTKGDHNNVEDSTLVNYTDVLGKVILIVPYIGYLQKFISTSYGWMLLIVLPCVCIIGSDIIKLIKKGTKDDSSNGDKKNKDKPLDRKSQDEALENLDEENI